MSRHAAPVLYALAAAVALTSATAAPNKTAVPRCESGRGGMACICREQPECAPDWRAKIPGIEALEADPLLEVATKRWVLIGPGRRAQLKKRREALLAARDFLRALRDTGCYIPSPLSSARIGQRIDLVPSHAEGRLGLLPPDSRPSAFFSAAERSP